MDAASRMKLANVLWTRKVVSSFMESETNYFKESEQVRPLDMSHLHSLELYFRLGRKLLLGNKSPVKKKTSFASPGVCQ